ncbi:MAG: peptidoglycan-binding protein [Acidobacteria bacterium]|nr:peptidoglycan-binding protein [Acidobacteriota bacterium]
MTYGVHKLAIAAILVALPIAASSKSSPSSGSQRTARTHITRTSAAHRNDSRSSKTRRLRGQQAIDPTRVREIQSALIRERYLEGDANGIWDTRTKAAMTRFQNDNGWQTRKVPDSRAIIKLGLGPDRADLINPDTAFTKPQPTGKGGAQQP